MKDVIISKNREEDEPDRFTQMTSAALHRLQEASSANVQNDANSYIDRASRRSLASLTSSKKRKSVSDHISNASLPSIRSSSTLRT